MRSWAKRKVDVPYRILMIWDTIGPTGSSVDPSCQSLSDSRAMCIHGISIDIDIGLDIAKRSKASEMAEIAHDPST